MSCQSNTRAASRFPIRPYTNEEFSNDINIMLQSVVDELKDEFSHEEKLDNELNELLQHVVDETKAEAVEEDLLARFYGVSQPAQDNFKSEIMFRDVIVTWSSSATELSTIFMNKILLAEQNQGSPSALIAEKCVYFMNAFNREHCRLLDADDKVVRAEKEKIVKSLERYSDFLRDLFHSFSQTLHNFGSNWSPVVNEAIMLCNEHVYSDAY